MDLSIYLGMAIEVQDINNRLITPAEIIDFGENYIELVNRQDHLPILIYRTSVKVVINMPTGMTVLVGHVTNSDRKRMQIAGLMSLTDFEKRAYFRVAISTPTFIYPIPGGCAPELEFSHVNAENAFSMNMVNISLSGILLEIKKSPKPLPHIGSKLYAEVNTNKKILLLKAIVRRHVIKENDDIKQIGCEFVDNKIKDIDLLCSELFRLQAAAVKKNKSV